MGADQVIVPKILISDAMDPRAAAIFRERGVQVDEITGQTADELKAIIGDYDGLAIRSSTKVTAALLAAAPRLKVVGRAGIGVDNIDVDAATKRGVVVANAPESNAIAAAEHTMALMLALCRRIPQAHASLLAGRWERKRFAGVEVYRKTLGVLGFGRIGQLVAERAKSFGMTVVGFDPFVSAERYRELGVERAESSPEVYERADILT
ncbi:MAG: phosphoglycerate dehydrogenase, partial [Sphingomonas sp.]|nr:phosphoglycerate dehydrogenase [Sphingomonas sp.]